MTAPRRTLVPTVLLLLCAPVFAQAEIPVPPYEPDAGFRAFSLPEFRLDRMEWTATPEPDDIVESIAKAIRPDVVRAGGDVLGGEGRLVVTGPAEAAKVARQRTREILDFLRGRGTVTVELTRDGEGRLWSGRFDVVRGRTSVLEQTEARRIVGDLEPEIAMDSAIVTPIPHTLLAGTRVAVVCHPLPSGRALVALSIHRSRFGEMRTVRTTSGTLDLPEIPFVSLFTTVVAEVGTPVEILVPAPALGGPLTARVTVVALPPESSARLLDLTPFARFERTAAVHVPAGVLDPDRLSELLETEPPTWGSTAGAATAFDSEDLEVVALAGGVVRVSGDTEARSAIARRLEGRIRAGTLLRTAGQTAWGKIDPLDPDSLADSLTDRPADRISLPLTTVAPAFVMTGTLHRFLAGLEAEVAGGSAVASPVIGNCFSGESMLLRLDEDGTVGVDRTRCVLLERERRDAEVRSDIEGDRTRDERQFVDHLRTSDDAAQLRVSGPVTEVRRDAGVGVGVVTTWSVR